jgi:hypothetical protein
MMSPFFPQGHSIYKTTQTDKFASRNDSALGELGLPPHSYKYYSKNSAKARKDTLHKWEMELVEELDFVSSGVQCRRQRDADLVVRNPQAS